GGAPRLPPAPLGGSPRPPSAPHPATENRHAASEPQPVEQQGDGPVAAIRPGRPSETRATSSSCPASWRPIWTTASRPCGTPCRGGSGGLLKAGRALLDSGPSILHGISRRFFAAGG